MIGATVHESAVRSLGLYETVTTTLSPLPRSRGSDGVVVGVANSRQLAPVRDQPVMFVDMQSDAVPMSALDEYAETIVAPRLSTVNGVAQVLVQGGQKYAVRVQVDPHKLRALNNPGLPNAPRKLPSPSLSGSPLPGDSPPIVVGTGMLAKNYIVVRTQHWQKSTDSYSLPGCSGLSVTQTQTSGVTRSTSLMSEVAGAVDVTTSLGWGPISAALSASMSRTSMNPPGV